jgi:hypothetical protein
MSESRAAGGHAMAAARELSGAARYAAYAAGQAAVVAHVAAHELGAAACAIKAARAAAPDEADESAGETRVPVAARPALGGDSRTRARRPAVAEPHLLVAVSGVSVKRSQGRRLDGGAATVAPSAPAAMPLCTLRSTGSRHAGLASAVSRSWHTGRRRPAWRHPRRRQAAFARMPLANMPLRTLRNSGCRHFGWAAASPRRSRIGPIRSWRVLWSSTNTLWPETTARPSSVVLPDC